jgi:hypothetical protein
MTATTVGRTVGWAPQWSRSGVRTRLWWTVAVLALGLQVVVLPYVDQHRFGLVTAIPWLYAWVSAGLVAEILVGLLFWMWRPQNVVGPLLVAWAALSQLGAVPSYFPHSRLALTFCLLFAGVFLALYVWMLFAFPNGTIWNRWALALLVVFSGLAAPHLSAWPAVHANRARAPLLCPALGRALLLLPRAWLVRT